MKWITVGVDGSSDSLHGLSWAADLAAATGARLGVVSALVPMESEVWPSRWEEYRRGRAVDLDRWCAPVTAATGVDVDVDVVSGDPREQLLQAAAEQGADLLVIGSGDVSGPEANRLRIGSVAEYLARHTDLPLVVVPPAAPLHVRSVLVGFDGSQASTQAARWAVEVAAAHRASVTAVAATEAETRRRGSPEADGVQQAWDALAVQGRLEVVRGGGKAPAVVASQARRCSADLVVMGMRGLGGFLGLRVGSTALGVLHDLDDAAIALVPLRSDEGA